MTSSPWRARKAPGARPGSPTDTWSSLGRWAPVTTFAFPMSIGSCTAGTARASGSRGERSGPASGVPAGCAPASYAAPPAVNPSRPGPHRPVPPISGSRSPEAPMWSWPRSLPISTRRRPSSVRPRRNSFLPGTSSGRPSRGGRVAKGGRLKICSRRSSQVQILAPAFVPGPFGQSAPLRRRSPTRFPVEQDPLGTGVRARERIRSFPVRARFRVLRDPDPWGGLEAVRQTRATGSKDPAIERHGQDPAHREPRSKRPRSQGTPSMTGRPSGPDRRVRPPTHHRDRGSDARDPSA
jgi:hypothetical protein